MPHTHAPALGPSTPLFTALHPHMYSIGHTFSALLLHLYLCLTSFALHAHTRALSPHSCLHCCLLAVRVNIMVRGFTKRAVSHCTAHAVHAVPAFAHAHAYTHTFTTPHVALHAHTHCIFLNNMLLWQTKTWLSMGIFGSHALPHCAPHATRRTRTAFHLCCAFLRACHAAHCALPPALIRRFAPVAPLYIYVLSSPRAGRVNIKRTEQNNHQQITCSINYQSAPHTSLVWLPAPPRAVAPRYALYAYASFKTKQEEGSD